MSNPSSQANSSLVEPFTRVDLPTAQRLIREGVQMIDVREPNEYAEGHIPGVKLVPLGTLLTQPQDYIIDDNLLFICAMGQRSALACEMAAAMGMEKVYNLEGGTIAWTNAGLPIER